jgi:hypothetical protein
VTIVHVKGVQAGPCFLPIRSNFLRSPQACALVAQ